MQEFLHNLFAIMSFLIILLYIIIMVLSVGGFFTCLIEAEGKHKLWALVILAITLTLMAAFPLFIGFIIG